MNSPIYAINNPAMGVSSQGAVQYCHPASGSSQMLPPSYSGSRWDDFTPWDTRAEKEAKEKAKEEAEEAYQERLANITANQPQATPPSPVLYAVMGLLAVGTLFFLAKPAKK